MRPYDLRSAQALQGVRHRTLSDLGNHKIRNSAVAIRSLRHRLGWSSGTGSRGIPLVIFAEIFGCTRFEPVNVVLGILGFFNLGLAVFNLLPVRPLDGSIGWGLIPALIDRQRTWPKKRPGWRGRP
jgi:hypothetical protein